jgi:hypothetical protein
MANFFYSVEEREEEKGSGTGNCTVGSLKLCCLEAGKSKGWLGKRGGKWQIVGRMEKERWEREKKIIWAGEEGTLGDDEDREF